MNRLSCFEITEKWVSLDQTLSPLGTIWCSLQILIDLFLGWGTMSRSLWKKSVTAADTRPHRTSSVPSQFIRPGEQFAEEINWFAGCWALSITQLPPRMLRPPGNLTEQTAICEALVKTWVASSSLIMDRSWRDECLSLLWFSVGSGATVQTPGIKWEGLQRIW